MGKRRVLITGASRGIGASTAKMLSRTHYQVIGTSRSPESIEDQSGDIEYVHLDLNSDDSIEECIRQVKSVDILINNAGQSHIGAAEEYPLERTRDLFDANLFGPARLIQGFLPGMRERGSGFILNVGSMTGRFAVPFQSGYVATKFALAGYTWALRNEVMRFGVKVVLLEPNDIKTDISPDFHSGNVEEYRENLLKMKNMRDSRMEEAPGPEIVARKIIKILSTKNPKPFYAVGGMGPLMVFAKRFLPDRTVESLVRKNYDISRR